MQASSKRALYIVGGLIAAFLLMGVGAAIGADDGSGDTTGSSVPKTVTQTITVTAQPSTVTAKPKTVTKTVVKTKTKTVTQRNYAPPQQNNVYYDNCTEASAAGDTPLYRGESGYASHLDGDGDGVACE